MKNTMPNVKLQDRGTGRGETYDKYLKRMLRGGSSKHSGGHIKPRGGKKKR